MLKACYPTLAAVKLDLFNTLVLPALQKAMLRNPEGILETVGLVLAGVNLDLSNCAMEIGSSLISKDADLVLVGLLFKTLFSQFAFER